MERTSEDMEAVREEFISLFRDKVKREGAERFLNWLMGTDFFSAPASTKFHCACPGGLALHSLNVYHVLRRSILRRATARRALPCAGCSTMCARPNSTKPPPAT